MLIGVVIGELLGEGRVMLTGEDCTDDRIDQSQPEVC